MQTNVVIYTDGSSIGVPPYIGVGGWAFVLVQTAKSLPTQIIERGGFIENATNNIAELTAIHEALKFVKLHEFMCNVTIVTDSRYCEGLLLYKNNGWEFNARKNINLILSIRSLILSMQSFAIERVKGHSNNVFNCLVDEIAGKCRRNKETHVKGMINA